MIIVTGAHRSGTSAVAMLLRGLGVDFGPAEEFYKSDQWNQRGYLERFDVVDLNSRLLTGCSRTRNPVSAGCSKVRYFLLPSTTGIDRRAGALAHEIEEVAGKLQGFGVKDPRFCLTLDAWEKFANSFIVSLRHPLAVAESLRRRQNIPLRLGLLFWNRHAEGLLQAPEKRSLFVDFDELSGDATESELAKIVGFLDLDEGLEGALATFRREFSPELRHFAAPGREALPEKTQRLWEALQERRDSVEI